MSQPLFFVSRCCRAWLSLDPRLLLLTAALEPLDLILQPTFRFPFSRFIPPFSFSLLCALRFPVAWNEWQHLIALHHRSGVDLPLSLLHSDFKAVVLGCFGSGRQSRTKTRLPLAFDKVAYLPPHYYVTPLRMFSLPSLTKLVPQPPNRLGACLGYAAQLEHVATTLA